tara:strand:+ start:47680 stop:48183 length:504 start_codon:yes stop_codon:yes gene_type:complete
MFVVTGIGPRCGTSFLMQNIKKMGIPVVGKKFPRWAVKEENPNGYYEINPWSNIYGIQHNDWKGKAVKLWPPVLEHTPVSSISKLIILERKDQDKQIKSIERVLPKELDKLGWEETENFPSPLEMINKSTEIIEDYIKYYNSSIISIYTEDLDDSLVLIEKFLKEPT